MSIKLSSFHEPRIEIVGHPNQKVLQTFFSFEKAPFTLLWVEDTKRSILYVSRLVRAPGAIINRFGI